MKTLLSISITAFTLSFVSIWNVQHASDHTSVPRIEVTAPLMGAPSGSKKPKIWVAEANLYQGESLEMHFSTPNAPYLGVLDPQGHFFYLVYPSEPTLTNLEPLVESSQFVGLKILIIETGSLKADPYTYGIYYNQPVFTASGDYTFILGDNLHVDNPDLLDNVVVHYTHKYRPYMVYCDL